MTTNQLFLFMWAAAISGGRLPYVRRRVYCSRPEVDWANAHIDLEPLPRIDKRLVLEYLLPGYCPASTCIVGSSLSGLCGEETLLW